MSQSFSDLSKKALTVRDHYNELQKADGRKTWNAQDRMAGFVGDVGELSKLIMVKHNLRRGPQDIGEAIEHELSDCLWSVIVLADELNVDLEEAFTRSMTELRMRIESEKVNKQQYVRKN
jgi:NTP pyrophosphatase (non-canonical NTP hydrolase)